MPLDHDTYIAILNRVAAGELVTDVANAYGTNRQMVWRYTENHPEAVDLYARARVAQAHSMAEDTVKLADDMGIPADQKRIMVDTRKWLITKIAPRIYGERIELQADVRHTVSGVIALPDEDPVPTLPNVTHARAFITGAPVTDTGPDDTCPSDTEGVWGGDGTGAGQA